MPKLRPVTRKPVAKTSVPAPAFQAETPKERYKECENEQTSLCGKASCYLTFLQEKAADR